MANISLTLTLPLQNEGNDSIEVILEPLAERFIVQPGQKVVIHAVFDEKTSNNQFTIAPNGSLLVIYTPGEIAGYVDSYMTLEGVRLSPVP